jgi:membrane protein DedA with SNARE-associated domain/rhodanese-related sulfurtransferase
VGRRIEACHPPSCYDILFVAHTIDFVVRHGYALLFFWILAEQAALPLPSAPLLLACGALAKDGRLTAHLIVLTGLAACLIPDSVWFAIGRRRGAKALRFICRLALEPDSCVRQTETAYQRYGIRSLLVAKFVPGLNAVSAPLAAISGVSFGKFVLFDTLGALTWICTFAGLGYIFSDQLDKVGDYAARMGSWVAVVVVGLLAAWIGWKILQRKRFLKKLAVARITATELRAMLAAGEDVVVVDVRTALESETDAVPGALRIPLEDLEARHGDIPRDRDIVLFCSCPNEASSARAALLLQKCGVVRVRPLYGGVDAWRALHRPV